MLAFPALLPLINTSALALYIALLSGTQTQVRGKVIRRWTWLVAFGLLCYGQQLSAQPSYYNWYFGDSCHVSFNGGTPQIITTGNRPHFARTGTVSVSDDQGNLLFYSNGRELRDGNMDLVANDLRAPGDAAMSAVATPVPNRNDEFLLFTTSRNLGTFINHDTVFYYHIYTNNGVTYDGPYFFGDSVNHKVLIVPHANQQDYWVIAPKGGSSAGPAYYTALITDTGVSPVTTQLIDHPFGVDGSAGYLRASPNGRLLATARNNSRFDIFSFEPENGTIRWLKSPELQARQDGIAFSPDGCDIYIVGNGATFEPGDDFPGSIYRYRIATNELEQWSIPGAFAENFQPELSSLQNGPDGWIYFSNQRANALGRFDPAASNPLATLDPEFLSFGTGTGTGTVQLGLPHPLPPQLDLNSVGCTVSSESTICLQTNVSIVPTDDHCCFRLLVDNEFAVVPDSLRSLRLLPPSTGAFTGLNLLGTAPGWSLSQEADGSILAVGTVDTLPQGLGQELLTFCLSENTTGVPSSVVATWSTASSIVCQDTLHPACTSCFAVVNDSLSCEPGGMRYTFNFVNDSSQDVNTISILPSELTTSDTLLSPVTIKLTETVRAGATYTGQLDLTFLDRDEDGSFCFDLVLRYVDPSLDVSIDCCFATHCVNADSTLSNGEPLPSPILLEPLASNELNCLLESATLSASQSGLPADQLQRLIWSGPNTTALLPPLIGPSVIALQPGNYTVTYTDTFGCTQSDSVTVIANRVQPTAIATDTLSLFCDDIHQLDASGSIPADGVFRWTALDGGLILSGDTTARPFVEGPGRYQLILTDKTNFCQDTVLTYLQSVDLPPASISPETVNCSMPQLLTGNLPPGTTGVWTSIPPDNSGWSATGNLATISSLTEPFRLLWTLSTPDCPDYSSDSLLWNPASLLNARTDSLEFGAGQEVSVNVLDNDEVSGPVIVNLLETPTFGTATLSPDGLLIYDPPVCFIGTTSLTYEITSPDCPELSSSATVVIFGEGPEVYNAITPDGDGLNETFVFDFLEFCPQDYPNNSIEIFNRWGDIIYKATPYQNEWAGLNQRGQRVPEGTYYYILRLNLGEGEIVRGDVTVIWK